MKNFKVGLIIFILIILTACNGANNKNEKAKATVQSHLENNYENVETIQFDKGDY